MHNYIKLNNNEESNSYPNRKINKSKNHPNLKIPINHPTINPCTQPQRNKAIISPNV